MSYIYFKSKIPTDLIASNPDLINLNSLDRESLPSCPNCGHRMVKNGKRKVEGATKNNRNKKIVNIIEVQRLVCPLEKQSIKIDYIPFDKNDPIRSDLSCKSILRCTNIFGKTETASRLGISVELIQEITDAISESSKPNNNCSIVSFHISNIEGRNYLIQTDVTDKVVLNIWAVSTQSAIIRKIKNHSKTFSKIIVPEEEKILTALRFSKGKNAIILETASENICQYNLAQPEHLEAIKDAVRKAKGFLYVHNFIFNSKVKEAIKGEIRLFD